MKKNERGYVLVWAMALIAVLTILAMTALAAAASYYRRSVEAYDYEQAAATARSMINLIAADLTGEGSGMAKAAILSSLDDLCKSKTDATDPVKLPSITFQTDEAIGTCAVDGWFAPESARLILTAEAIKNRERYRITAILERAGEESEDDWEVIRFDTKNADELVWEESGSQEPLE